MAIDLQYPKMFLLMVILFVVTACYIGYILRSPDFQFEIVAGGWMIFLIAIFVVIMIFLYHMAYAD